MNIAFVSLPVAGHLNPMSALAARVQSRGHEVCLFSVLDAQARAETAGLRFIPVGKEHFPPGITPVVEKQLSELRGEEGLRFTFGLMAQITGAILRELESKLAAELPDGVVFDTYQPYLELSALALGIPYIHVSNAAPFDVSGETPLCFFDGEPADTAEARERNLRGITFFRELLEPSLQAAQKYAAEKKMTVDWQDLTATRSRLAWITQLPAVVDFISDRPDHPLLHAGPFVNPHLRPVIEFPWDRLSGAPLVYLSMGTLQNGLAEGFHQILEAIRPIIDHQFVLSLGNNLDRAQFEPVAENVILVAQAPQLDLLRRSSLCVTHAGLNTVLEALAQGVPIVAIPVTNDQPGVAARIRATEVGDCLPIDDLSADRLRTLIEKVLVDPKFKKNAERVAGAIREIDGLSLASERIESVFAAELLKSTVSAN